MSATYNPAHATELLWEGHYRTRADIFDSLSLSAENAQAEGLSSALNHRARLAPTWHLSHTVRLHSQIDLLRGVRWGSQAVSPTDPATGETLSSLLGQSVQSPTTDDGAATLENIHVTRLWSEIDTEFGVLAFGRQPLHWGSGMVWNAGNRIEDEYGDTMDRVSFTSQAGPVYLTAAYETRVENFVAEQDDYHGFVGQVLYITEQSGVGMTNILRTYSNDGTSFRLYTGDLWASANIGDAEIEAEFAANLGQGDLDTGENNLTIGSFGGQLTAGYETNGIRIGFGGGFATGDANPDDSEIKTFSFDSDFNVGIMLFETNMPVLEATIMNENNDGRDTEAIRVSDGISNALYLRPRVGYRLDDNTYADLYVLAANQAKPEEGLEEEKGYGMEIGAHISYQPMPHVSLDGVAAAFLPGSYFTEYESDNLGGGFNQPALGGRIVASVEF